MSSPRNRKREKGGRNQRLAGLAADQEGVVSLDQLRQLEVTRRAASHRAEVGGLHRVHRGVYAVGHPAIGRVGALRAALLACGEGSAVSHGTAAAFWGLRDHWPVLIDITVRCQTGRKIDGIYCRRCRHPNNDEVRAQDGVLCTTPARTLEALVLPRLLARGLPRPACNASLQIDGHRTTPDFLWGSLRVVVETDGEGSHGTPVAFQRDRKRDQILVAAGYRVARATWRQMYHELDDVVTRISRTLELAAASQPTPQLLNRVVP